MYISWNWLNRHVDLSGLDPREVGEQFTLKVAELDGVEERGGGLEAMRAVEIVSVRPVEGAKKLSLVTVRDGDDERTVVCGAPNAKDGVGKVAVLAPPGCTLPDGTEIREAEIRGITSAGMLASEAELGLSESHDGILLLDDPSLAGRSFVDAVPVHDWVWEVDNKAITHRPDLWGHHGIAREVAVLVDRPLRPLEPVVEFGDEDRVRVRIEAEDLCPRYLCTVFEDVEVGPSPQWLQQLLQATGVRPISNVVDLTNFVMMDAGNPLHAFDARFVAQRQGAHEIVVRRAEAGETIQTLDGQPRECTEDTLLICDAEGPIALAGVMGGENSEIRDDTTTVVLEAANFDAGSIRKTSVRTGLRTDSSARFEKALDPVAAATAARQFSSLMREVIPGCRIVAPLVDVGRPAPDPVVVALNPKRVSQRLGIEVSIGHVRQVLTRLGFSVQDRSSGLLHVTAPTWRATRDVRIEEDLIEEIGRLHGYVNIPPQPPRVAIQRPWLAPQKDQERASRRFLSAGCGLHEVLSYAFTWRPMLERLGAETGGRLMMANSISQDLDRMRRSLVPNLLKFVEENSRFAADFGLYEIGRVFHPVEGALPQQPRTLGVAMAHAEADGDAEGQYRKLRGVMEGVLGATRAAEATWRRPTAEEIGWRAAWVHPQRSVWIEVGGTFVGYATALHPRARDVLDVRAPVSVAEIDLDALLAAGSAPHRYRALPRFPGMGFDVSFEVNESVTAGTLEAAIHQHLDTPLFRGCRLFANYHLDNGNKSVSFHLEFRADDRSLVDEEVHGAVEAMVARVSEATGAALRGG